MLLLVAAAALVGAGTPNNATACHPNPMPVRPDDDVLYFMGWQKDSGSTVGGIYGTVRQKDPHIYPGSTWDNTASAWVMLNNAAHNRYAQIGWLKLQTFRYSFTEFKNAAGTKFTYLMNPEPLGVDTEYKVLYDNYAPGYISFYTNNVLKHIVPPADLGWTPPVASQNMAETHSLATQMPGTLQSREWFGNVHFYFNGIWNNYDGGAPFYQPSYALAYFGYQKHSTLIFSLWDKCTS